MIAAGGGGLLRSLRGASWRCRCSGFASTSFTSDPIGVVPQTSAAAAADGLAIGSPLASTESEKSFASMFRHSKFVQLGDFDGRLVVGKIVHRVLDDLYIDVGLKFNAVCKAPPVGDQRFVLGASVLVRLHDPELSELFLGAKRDLTLLEADATLLRLYKHQQDPSRRLVEGSEATASVTTSSRKSSSPSEAKEEGRSAGAA